MNYVSFPVFRSEVPAWVYAHENTQALCREISEAIMTGGDDDGRLPVGPFLHTMCALLNGNEHQRRNRACQIVSCVAMCEASGDRLPWGELWVRPPSEEELEGGEVELCGKKAKTLPRHRLLELVGLLQRDLNAKQ